MSDLLPRGEGAQDRSKAGRDGPPHASATLVENQSADGPGGIRGYLLKIVRHSVFKNASMLFIVSLLNYVMPLILIPYLARVLRIELFGVYAFGMSIYLIGMVLIDYGFQIHGLYAITENREDPERVGRLLGSMLVIRLGLYILLTALLGAYVWFNKRFVDYRMFLMLTALPVLGGALQFRWVFQAVEQSWKIVSYTMIGRVLQVVLVIALVAGPQDYLWVPISHGISMIVSGLLCIRMIHGLGYRFGVPRWNDIREQLHGASSYFLATVATAQLGFAGIVALSLVVAPAVLAVYAVAEQLYRALRSLYYPISDALMPYMRRSNDIQLFRRICMVVVLGTAVGIGLGIVLAPHVIFLLFGAKYEEAVPILQILLPGLIAFAPATMIGYPLLAAMGHGPQVNRIAMFSAIALTSALALLGFLGLLNGKSAAMAVVVSEFLILLGTMALLWRVRVARQLAGASAPMSQEGA